MRTKNLYFGVLCMSEHDKSKIGFPIIDYRFIKWVIVKKSKYNSLKRYKNIRTNKIYSCYKPLVNGEITIYPNSLQPFNYILDNKNKVLSRKKVLKLSGPKIIELNKDLYKSKEE